jgi:hypothetical protein
MATKFIFRIENATQRLLLLSPCCRLALDRVRVQPLREQIRDKLSSEKINVVTADRTHEI